MADESPFDKKLKEQAAATVFQLVWSFVERVGEAAWQKTAVSQALNRYSERYCDRHGWVKVLGLSSPIPLRQLYTAARVVPRDYLGAFTNPHEMQQDFIGAGRMHRAFIRAGDAMDMANQTPYLNVLGAPGSGKSTLLRRVGMEAMLMPQPGAVRWLLAKLGLRYNQARIPVLIELQTLRRSPVDLLAVIAEEFAICGFPNSPRFVDEALSHGKLLVLLDGLDEVPAGMQKEVIEHVSGFVDKYSGESNRFVTSCRTAHYKNAFPRFTDVVLADFSDDQIRQFAENWFAGPEGQQAGTAHQFYTELQSAHNMGALELARTPLLLTFLCLTYAHGQAFPPTRATLYRRALELLLREWAAERRVHGEPIDRDLHAELEIDMLAELAETLFREERFFFNRDRVTGHIKHFMGRQLEARRMIDSDKILEAIEVQQGLIVRRADDVYSFSHLTIQEYLTAKSIWDAGEQVWRMMVDDHLLEPRWQVVFELMAGLGAPDRLFENMGARISLQLHEAYKKREDVQRVFEWIHGIAPSTRMPSQQAAAIRLGLLAALSGCSPIDGRTGLGLSSWPQLHELIRLLDKKTAAFIEDALETFRSQPDVDESMFIETVVEIFRSQRDPLLVEAAPEGRAEANTEDEEVSSTHKAKRMHAIRAFLDNRVFSQSRAAAEFGDSVQVSIASSFDAGHLAQSVAALREENPFQKSLSAWELVMQCKRTCYRLDAAAWDRTCRHILDCRSTNSCSGVPG